METHSEFRKVVPEKIGGNRRIESKVGLINNMNVRDITELPGVDFSAHFDP